MDTFLADLSTREYNNLFRLFCDRAAKVACIQQRPILSIFI